MGVFPVLFTGQLMDKSPELTPENYINRELSWIDFNCRVLAQAMDESIPLLDRIKFLRIVSSTTAEFRMVGVAFVHEKLKLGLPTTRPDGIPYPVLMADIRQRIAEMMHQQREMMADLLGRLAQYGLVITSIDNL